MSLTKSCSGGARGESGEPDWESVQWRVGGTEVDTVRMGVTGVLLQKGEEKQKAYGRRRGVQEVCV